MAKATRSISAWAEASHPGKRHQCRGEVYLRVGGGILFSEMRKAAAKGLSPRGRRHPARIDEAKGPARSISAWAEASAIETVFKKETEVYLRVGGGICFGIYVKQI